AGERQRFTLDVNASVFFFEAPVGIETPEISVAVAYGNFALVGSAWILDFGHARTHRIGKDLLLIHPAPVNEIFGIESNSGESLLVEAHEDLEVITLVGDGVGGDHFRLVEFGAMVVVLDDGQRLRQIGAGDEDQS